MNNVHKNYIKDIENKSMEQCSKNQKAFYKPASVQPYPKRSNHRSQYRKMEELCKKNLT
jgi:hypothetical protein